MNKDITLVILAAGMGIRFGGLKREKASAHSSILLLL